MRRSWGPAPARFRGQPLALMALLLVGWVTFRASVIELPAAGRLDRLPLVTSALASRPVHARDHAETTAPAPTEDRQLAQPRLSSPPESDPLPERPVEWGAAGTKSAPGGETLLWMAAMSDLPLPAEIAQLRETTEKPAKGPHARFVDSAVVARTHEGQQRVGQGKRQGSRWSFDGWLLLRAGASAAGSLEASGLRPPSYGLSQLGAVLRYWLAPGSDHRPAAYVRASRGLVRQGETEVAAGFAARPVSRLPVTAHAEIRATRQGSTTRLRPAAFVSTGIDRAPLPLGFSARGYVQAGYVGGEFATAFADASLAVEREVARLRHVHLKAGGGSWAGIQKGAGRLDVGPSASLGVSVGSIPARVSLDYRLRVLGDAEPTRGAALTLSTGF